MGTSPTVFPAAFSSAKDWRRSATFLITFIILKLQKTAANLQKFPDIAKKAIVALVAFVAILIFVTHTRTLKKCDKCNKMKKGAIATKIVFGAIILYTNS